MSRVAQWSPGMVPIGRHVNQLGYVVLRFAPSKEMLEHRWVVMNQLQRQLTRGECVHHINHQRDDNRPENLQLTTHKVHKFLHNGHPGRCPVCRAVLPGRRAKYCNRKCMAVGYRKPKPTCRECKKVFDPGHNTRRNKCCSRDCFYAFAKRVGWHRAIDKKGGAQCRPV